MELYGWGFIIKVVCFLQQISFQIPQRKCPLRQKMKSDMVQKNFNEVNLLFRKNLCMTTFVVLCLHCKLNSERESNCLQLFLKVAGIVWMHCQISFLHLQMSWSVISKLIEAVLFHLQDKYLLVSLLALVTIWKLNVVLKHVIWSTMFVRRWFMYCVYMSLQHKMQASLIQPSLNGCLHFSCRLKRYVNAFVLQETLFL